MKHLTALLLTLTLTAATAAPSGPVSAPLKSNTLDLLPRVVAVIQKDPFYGRELMAEGPTVEAALKFTFADLLEYGLTSRGMDY